MHHSHSWISLLGVRPFAGGKCLPWTILKTCSTSLLWIYWKKNLETLIMTHPSNNLMPIYETFLNESSLLFFILDQQGTILSANRSAHKFLGDTLTGKPFESIVLDFYNTFDLDSLRQKENVVHSLNLKRRNGLPQTYLFKFKTHGTSIYAVGELDNDELEAVRKEILG